jgi:nitroimidazol reductase NimA-like FMN-containing flavoprotein (pyridoxamine 5'-phosphate oxidase superfamily)
MKQSRQTLELTRDECWQLLREASLGRVVFTMNALPAIRPVNHIVEDETIIIRSQLGSAITGHASRDGAVVCYEADEIDPVGHIGWTVIATGIARLVRDPSLVDRYQRALESWAERTADQVIAIAPEMLSGVRLVGSCMLRAPWSPGDTW